MLKPLYRYIEMVEAENASYKAIGTPSELAELVQKVNEGRLVEVVRCEKCEHFSEGICELFSEEPDQISRGHYHHTSLDGFCSYGERKAVR